MLRAMTSIGSDDEQIVRNPQATDTVVQLLASASGARVVADGGALLMTDATTPVVAIEDRGMAAPPGRGTPNRRSIAAIESIPRTLSLVHYDAARDYQTGTQRAQRPGAGFRDEQVDLPASLSAPAAKALAEAMLARAEVERERRSIALAADAAGIAPGAIVAIAGEAGRWRVIETALEAMVTTLTLVRVAPAAMTTSASSGRALPAPDRRAGRTIIHAAELPALGDSALSAPRIVVMATGSEAGWRSAALLYSLDDGATWRDGGITAAPAVIGAVVLPPGAAPATLVDCVDTIEVDLARPDMTLADADDRLLDGGANLALLGNELIQFGRATPIAARRWRLSRLLRGRRGTEWAIGTQAVGDRFVALTADAMAVIDLPVAALGSTLSLLASGIGDGDGPVATSCVVDGASVRPPSPAHLTVDWVDGVPTARWNRRSRTGFRWIDGSDVPLVEERESYRVTITAADGSRSVVVSEPNCAISADDVAGGATIEVRQLGTLGESRAARLSL